MQEAKQKLKILFLCTGNSCRSQMAEGWTRHLKGDVIEAYSAGIETHGLNPNAVKVMAEAGVDIANHRSKHLDELEDIPFDYVVTVCDHAHESCPLFPGNTRIVHVGFDDPPRLAKDAESEEAALDCYRRVRDEIKAFVERLPASLAGESRGDGVMLDNKTKELIAIGCSVAANCHPCVKFHVGKAREMGIEAKAIDGAIAIGQKVRKGAAGEMDELLAELELDGQNQ